MNLNLQGIWRCMTILGRFSVYFKHEQCFQMSLDTINNMSMEYLKDEKIDTESYFLSHASVRDEDQPARYVCQEAVVNI